MKRIMQINDLKAAGAYAFATIAGDTIYTAGQVGLSAGKLVEGGIEAETRQVMDNLAQVLKATGVGFDDVVKATVYVTDADYFSMYNEIYSSYFTEGKYPARETVIAAALPLGAKIEISLVASVPTSNR